MPHTLIRSTVFGGRPANLRQLVLALYAITTPVFVAVLVAFAPSEHRILGAGLVAGFAACAIAWLLARREPGANDWIYPAVVAPTLCCGVAAWLLPATGPAFLAALAAPVAWSAMLFGRRGMLVAWTLGTLTVLVVVTAHQDATVGVGNAIVFAVVQAIVASVAQGRSWRHRTARLRSLEHHLNDIELIHAPDGRIVHANDRAIDAYGGTLDDLLGRTIHELELPSGDAARPGVDVAPRSALTYETLHRRLDGSTFPVEVSSRVFELSGIAYRHSVVRDISARRQQDAEQRFLAALVEEMQEGVVTVDPIDIVRTWSPGAARMFGWSAEEAIGLPLPAFLAAAIPRDTAAEVPRTESTATGARRQSTRGPRKDGREIVCDAAATVLRDNDGRASGALLVFRDVTFEHAAQQALRRSEERYRSVVAAMAEGVVLQRADGTVDTCNASAARMLGLPQGQVVHRSAFDSRWQALRENGTALPTDEQPAMVTLRTGVAQYGAVMGLQKPDGSVTWVSVNTQPLRTAASAAPYAVIATFSDVTARKQAEADHLRLQREVLDTQRRESLSVLAGGIAHDFNNLLTAIMGSAELALAEIGDQYAVFAHLEQVQAAGRRAAQLCAQMLMYAGRHGATFQAVDVNDIVRNASDLLRASLPATTRLELDLADRLPPVWGDQTHLQHMLINIATNAVEALGARRGVIRLRTRPELHQSTAALVPTTGVCLSVSDDGPGMRQEVLARAFEPFFTTRFAGRGLGLPAAQGIARGHGGTISLKSEEGRGTQVDVLLPGLQQPPSTSIDDRVRDRDVAARLSGPGLVLVVDDEDPVRETCRQMLARIGFASLGARTGFEAVELFREHRDGIAAVVLDLTMPGMSGYETLTALRSIDPDVRVLLSSGYAEPSVLAGVTGPPVAAFLGKPFSLPDLQSKLGSALRA